MPRPVPAGHSVASFRALLESTFADLSVKILDAPAGSPRRAALSRMRDSVLADLADLRALEPE